MSDPFNKLVGCGTPTDIAHIILGDFHLSDTFTFDCKTFPILYNPHMILYILLDLMSGSTEYVELIIARDSYKFDDELVNGKLETLLKYNTDLHTLRIIGCESINRDGRNHLCAGLKSNTTLRCLDLSRTKFEDNYNDRTIETLCQTLQNNTSLTSLNITGCAKVRNIYNLNILISCNATLTHLSFSISKSHPPNLDSFIDALKTNYTLLHINIENIDKFSDWKQSIERYLERNRKLL